MNYAGQNFYWVVVEDGRMFMHDPNGKRIDGEIVCEVIDRANEAPKAVFRSIVNIAGSVEEMMANNQESKK